MYVITIHQRHRRTDRRTTCDRKSVLCMHCSASCGKNRSLLLVHHYITDHQLRRTSHVVYVGASSVYNSIIY